MSAFILDTGIKSFSFPKNLENKVDWEEVIGKKLQLK